MSVATRVPDLNYVLDFEQKLPPETQEGMQRADENANEEWKRVTDACILAVARRLAEFTVDDVLDEMKAMHNPFETHNLSALGPRMKEVAKTLKYMTATNELRRSRKPEKHSNLHRVWKSNYYRRG